MLNINIQDKIEETFADLELYLEGNMDCLKESYQKVLTTLDQHFRHFEDEANDLFLRKVDPHYNHTMLTLQGIFPDLTTEQIREQELTRRGIASNDRLCNPGTKAKNLQKEKGR